MELQGTLRNITLAYATMRRFLRSRCAARITERSRSPLCKQGSTHGTRVMWKNEGGVRDRQRLYFFGSLMNNCSQSLPMNYDPSAERVIIWCTIYSFARMQSLQTRNTDGNKLLARAAIPSGQNMR